MKKWIRKQVIDTVSSLNNENRIQLPDKEKMILVYCHSGMRARKAAMLLGSLGYKDVRSIGGVVDWTYDLEK